MSPISVVMPSHNRGYDLHRVLSAYDQQDLGEKFEVIVVDDGSTDSTYQVAKSFRPSRYVLQTKRLDRNKGSGAARNIAFELATQPIVLIVGDDILPEHDFVRQHLTAHRWYPEKEYAILGRIDWPDDLPRNSLMEHIVGIGAQQFSYHYLVSGKVYDFRHFYTSNISVKRALLSELDNWFDPDFSHYGFEDIELAYRLREKGLQILYLSSPLGRHYHFHTIWTFTKRQYYAGMMSCVFNRKHPKVIGRAPYYIDRYKRILTILSRFTNIFWYQSVGSSEWLEHAALHLSSFFEWKPNPLLDRLYIGLLNYFWHKGTIDGTINDPVDAMRYHDLHASYALTPLLKSFLTDADNQAIPLPHGFGTTMLKELSTLGLFSLRRPLRRKK